MIYCANTKVTFKILHLKVHGIFQNIGCLSSKVNLKTYFKGSLKNGKLIG